MDRMAKDREEKALRFATFCGYRFKTDLTEYQIASKLGFRSPEALYKQLEIDGSPLCGVCGLLYPEAGHPKEHERKPQPKLNTETWIKLPNAMNAGGLFRKALEEYNMKLDLVGSEESWLRGKSIRTYIVDRPGPESLWRESYTEAKWKKLCERYDADPETTDELYVPVDSAGVVRVGRAPSKRLIALIAAYALAGWPLRTLIERLHPEPDSADERGVEEKVDQLWEAADHLATLVRGGKLGKGNRPPEVPDEEVIAAWLIHGLEEEEELLSDEEVLARLKETLPSIAEGLTANQIYRIRHSGLKPPQ
jgi:hypothetical protein